jgi:hypothetical protein
VNAQLAAEPQAARAQRIGGNAVHVPDAERHAVDRRIDARQSRGQHQLGPREQQREIVAFDAQVLLEIDRTEGQPPHLRARREHARRGQAARGLHQRHDGQPRARRPGHRRDGLRCLGLGQHHRRDARQPQQLAVLAEPRRVDAVDANAGAHLHVAVSIAIAEQLAQLFARGLLVRRRHGVLEVEHHHVGAAGEGLGEPLWPVRGYEEIGNGLHVFIVRTTYCNETVDFAAPRGFSLLL